MEETHSFLTLRVTKKKSGIVWTAFIRNEPTDISKKIEFRVV